MNLLLIQVLPGELAVETVALKEVKPHPTRDEHFAMAVYAASHMGRGGTTVSSKPCEVIEQQDIDPNPYLRCWCEKADTKKATKALLNASLDFAKECLDGWNTKALALRMKLGKL